MKKIISGGQTGVDQLALKVAKLFGIETGGYLPRDCMTERGRESWLIQAYDMKEANGGYPDRTRMNVLTSGATLILFYKEKGLGTSLTASLCRQYDKDYVEVNLANYDPLVGGKFEKQEEAVSNLLINHEVVNVAGPRGSKMTQIQTDLAVILLVRTFKEFKRGRTRTTADAG